MSMSQSSCLLMVAKAENVRMVDYVASNMKIPKLDSVATKEVCNGGVACSCSLLKLDGG